MSGRVPLPAALRGVFFDGCWERERVWALPTPPSVRALAELDWHLDLPVWSTAPPAPLFDLAPRAVLAAPQDHAVHTARIAAADVSFPLELFERGGRWVVLDGYHRLARHVQLGSAAVPVRLHPSFLLTEISSC